MEDFIPTTFKAIFTFQDFTQYLEFDNLTLQVILGDSAKTVSIPFKQALLIEAGNVLPDSKAQFQIEDSEGDIVGYSELRIPDGIFFNGESEVNQEIEFHLVKGSKPSFTTNVFVIFLSRKEKKTTESVKIQIQEVQVTSETAKVISRQDIASYKINSDENTPDSKLDTSIKFNDQDAINKFIQQHKVENNITDNFLEEAGLLPSRIVSKQEIITHRTIRSDENTPNSKLNTSVRKEVNEQEAISKLIKLNKNENNLPGNFLDEAAQLRNKIPIELQMELDSPFSRESAESPAIQTRTAKSFGFKRSNTQTISETQEKAHTKKPSLSKEKSMVTKTVTYEMTKKSSTQDSRKVFNTNQISAFENIELTDDKKMSQVLAMMERELSDKGFKGYIDYIKNTVLTMEFRINELTTVRNENENLRAEAQLAQEAKYKIEERSSATIESLKKENEALRNQIQSVLVQNEAVNNKSRDFQIEAAKAKENALKANLSVVQKDNELSEANLKNAELEELKLQLKRAQEALVRGEVQRADDQKNFMEALAVSKKSLEDNKVLLEKIFQEKRDLALQFAQEKFAHQDVRNEHVLCEKKIQTAEAYKETIKSLELQRDDIVKQLEESRKDRNEVYKLMERAQGSLNEKLKEFEAKESEYVIRITTLEESFKNAEKNILNLSRDLNSANLDISELKSQIMEAERVLAAQQNLNEELENLRERLSQTVEDRTIINRGIETLTHNHEQMAHKVFELERTKENLISVISEKNQEIVELRTSLAEALNQEVDIGYTPVKDDPVDCALANCLNNHKDGSKYRMLFIREGSGVYQFGTKKIYIKIEGDKVLIRVGGGYMTFEELLTMLAPSEYEKLIRYSKSGDTGGKFVTKNLTFGKQPEKNNNTRVNRLARMATAIEGELGSPINKVDLREAFSPKASRAPL